MRRAPVVSWSPLWRQRGSLSTVRAVIPLRLRITVPYRPDVALENLPPGARVSTTASGMYGTVIRTLRGFTARTADKEPKWRAKGSELLTGYQKTW